MLLINIRCSTCKIANGLLILLLLNTLLSCSDTTKVYPEKKRLIESVYASLTVIPDSLYQAYASVQGILDTNFVEEGDLIGQGEPILKIVNITPLLTKDNAALEVVLAKENYVGNAAVLNSILDEIEAAELQLWNDSINFVRQQRLWDQNIGSKIEYDNKKMAFELSQNRVSSLERQYRRTAKELQTRLEQAQNSYRSASAVTRDYIIQSKINGKVYALYKNPGELVNTQEPVAAVGHSKDFILELIIDEVDIIKLNPGQKMAVTLDAYPSEVFNAALIKIYPKKEERNQTFKAEARFVTPPPKLYSGLAGEANIIIAVKDSALTIPKDYLLSDNEVLTEDGRVSVVLGLQNLELVEITGGLDESTAILKPTQ